MGLELGVEIGLKFSVRVRVRDMNRVEATARVDAGAKAQD